jgi:putative transposase
MPVMDFGSDRFVDGRRLGCLYVVDDFTKECLVIKVDIGLPISRDVDAPEKQACVKLVDANAYLQCINDK